MYTDINLLPYAVVSALPSDSERRKWMFAFNKAYKATGDANKSIFEAWDAMKNSPECRHIEGWFSTDKLDAQMDKIEQRQMNKSLHDFIVRGGVIVDTHSNRTVGAAYHADLLQKDEGLGNYGYAVIFHGTPYHDLVWEKILKGEIGGFSVGGFTLRTATECEGWACYRKILDQGVHETSVCSRPINDESRITKFNAMAKAEVPAESSCGCTKPIVGKDKVENDEPAVDVPPDAEMNKTDELLANSKLKKAFSQAYRTEKDPKVRKAFLKSYNILLANRKLSEKLKSIEDIGCPRCMGIINKGKGDFDDIKDPDVQRGLKVFVKEPKRELTGLPEAHKQWIIAQRAAQGVVSAPEKPELTAVERNKQALDKQTNMRAKSSVAPKGKPSRTQAQRAVRNEQISEGSKLRGAEVAGKNLWEDREKTAEAAARAEETRNKMNEKYMLVNGKWVERKPSANKYPADLVATYKRGELEDEDAFNPIDVEEEIEDENSGRTDLWHSRIDPNTNERVPIGLAQTDAETFPILNSMNRTFNMYATARLRGRKHFVPHEVMVGKANIKMFLPVAYEKDTPEYRQGRKAFYESFMHPIYNKNGRLIDYVNQVVHTKYPQMSIEDKAKLRNVIMDKYYDKFTAMSSDLQSNGTGEVAKFLGAHFNRIKKDDMPTFANTLYELYNKSSANNRTTNIDDWLANAVGGEPRLLKRALNDPSIALKYLYLRKLLREKQTPNNFNLIS